MRNSGCLGVESLYNFAFIGFVPIAFAFMLITILLFHSDKPGFAFAICWLAFYSLPLYGYSAWSASVHAVATGSSVRYFSAST